MKDICVFGKYKVDFKNKYTYISDNEFNEYTYSEEREDWTKDMEGEELMNLIGNLIIDNNTIAVSNYEDGVTITMFDPMDGTGSDIIIRYEALPNSLLEVK